MPHAFASKNLAIRERNGEQAFAVLLARAKVVLSQLFSFNIPKRLVYVHISFGLPAHKASDLNGTS